MVRYFVLAANALDYPHRTQVSSRLLSQRMADELMNMSLDEAMPLSWALGHYLGLTSIAELHHRCAAC